VEVWQTSNLRQLRLGKEEKKEERKKKPQGKNIMVCPIPYGDHNNTVDMSNDVTTTPLVYTVGLFYNIIEQVEFGHYFFVFL